MINEKKWLETISHNKNKDELNQIDPEIWTKTISVKKKISPIAKYSLLATLFVTCLFFVSAVKNETRSLQKEINNLEASISKLKHNLKQTVLDNEVITSPDNISLLAKKYLSEEFYPYKKSQIKELVGENEALAKLTKEKSSKKNKILKKKLKLQVEKQIEQKKVELRKLQDLYSNPKKIPDELKTQVAKKIEKTKIELKNLYDSPTQIITLEKVQRWGVVQVVKRFLGIPVIPGK